MEKRFVYADNAATTPVTPAVLEAMTPWLMENYGNPSSIYSIGRAARTAVEKARRQVAAALNAEPGEIYFTSCGTEAPQAQPPAAADAGFACVFRRSRNGLRPPQTREK